MFSRGHLSFIATNLILMTSVTLCQAQQATQPSVSPEVREAWRKIMVGTPLPKNGCFKAEYPSTEWHEVPCGRPSPYLNQKGGNGVGVNQVAYGYSGSNLISSAQSSLPSIAGGSYMNGASGDVLGNSPADTNIFILHRNTQSKFNLLSGFNDFPSTFSMPACSVAPNGAAGCYGRRQFLFSQTQVPVPGPGQSVPGAQSNTPSFFIEYWPLNLGPTGTCPTVPSRAVPQVMPQTTTWRRTGSGDC
jgi:hypothetical protein